ncbi:hypothetical protein [Streptomyces sp. NEAU-H3]|uniref:hypothetical protein n=1 Tax=Streptomyces sp. NEAU-H3 TaxID=2720636 RepID=UPI001439CAFC|nr:hypothetical protein [Streptomyces sp. NEAU-H3]NJA59180.1 hypothetical protein [Streptomyces sp. NEAU-H3]
MSEQITYKQLQALTTVLEKRITRHAEAIRQETRFLGEEARDTQRTAEQIAAKGVDILTVAETQDLARIMQGLADGLTAYAAAGDTTARQAKAVYDANHTSHNGIQEQIQRSPVGRDIYNLDRTFLEQQ